MLEIDLKHHLVSKILAAVYPLLRKNWKNKNKSTLIQIRKISFFSFLKSSSSSTVPFSLQNYINFLVNSNPYSNDVVPLGLT